MKRLLQVVFFTWMVGSSYGQDAHYSMFFNSPLNLSPGLTGVYQCNQRYHANYKRQWHSVPVEYQSFDIGADIKFKSDLDTTANYFSLGALLNYDQAGDLNLSYTSFDLMGSYSLELGPGFLTPGIGLGINFRNYDTTDALVGEFWDGTGINLGTQVNDPLYIGQDSRSITFFDVGVGLNYRYLKEYRKFIDIGVSLNNILGPSQIFASPNVINDESNLNRKINVYGMANWQLASKFDLLLNALGSFQGPYQEIVLNGQGKIYLGNENALYLGIGYRVSDAFIPMIALQFKNIYAAFSYDINISDFDKATDGRGGPEFAVRYMICPSPFTPRKPCPIY